MINDQKSLDWGWETPPVKMWRSWEQGPRGAGTGHSPSSLPLPSWEKVFQVGQRRESWSPGLVPHPKQHSNHSLELLNMELLNKEAIKRAHACKSILWGTERGWSVWNPTQAGLPCAASSRILKPQISPRHFPSALYPTALSAWFFLPLMISGRKPLAATDLACYHLVAQSLKEDLAALSTCTARHGQDISKRGPLGNKPGSWCGTTVQRDGHTCIFTSRLLWVWAIPCPRGKEEWKDIKRLLEGTC